MKILLPRCALLATLVFAPVALAQTDMSKVEIKATALAGGVSMLRGRGGNIGVFASADGVIMIDDQFAPLSEKIKTAVATLSDEPILYLINTHWHFDHSGGNENFAKDGVVIVAHDNVRKRMGRDEFIEAYKRDVPAAPQAALPVVTFNSHITLYLGGETISVHHTPHAHTDGDSFIHFENANVIHAGDVFFNGNYPFIDTSSGGGIEGMIKGTKNMLAVADDQTKIIPGHGALANKADLTSYLEMLETARDRATEALNKSQTLSQFTFTKPMKDFDEKWGNGFIDPERFMRIVYMDLSAK